MAGWKKEQLTRENGEIVEMQAPEVVSASRSTDIPAFYADWFFHRLRVGYSAWTNPFNGVRSYVAYHRTRFIVFWSKNPKPLLPHLPYLTERGIGCYVQFSLNDYDHERLEPSVPPVQERIDTFRRLVDTLGVGGVVWRFDPLVLTDTIDVDTLLEKVRGVGEQLLGYTEKLVFSFADIATYRKVKANLQRSGFNCREWDEQQMHRMAQGLSELNHAWGYQLGTCGERIDLSPYGIEHNHCIDHTLIVRRAWQDETLMQVLKTKIYPAPEPNLFAPPTYPEGAILLPGGRYALGGATTDKGQRPFCGCMASKDIGEYNTCAHLCEYCYANASKQTALNNRQAHLRNPLAETITGT